jgi:hypothetical protein
MVSLLQRDSREKLHMLVPGFRADRENYLYGGKSYGEYLYDLSADPEETDDVSEQYSEQQNGPRNNWTSTLSGSRQRPKESTCQISTTRELSSVSVLSATVN